MLDDVVIAREAEGREAARAAMAEAAAQPEPAPVPQREREAAPVAPMREAQVDTLVLGCTHYPLLTGVISYVMGDDVTLVSSAEETAKDVLRVLTELDALRPHGGPDPVRRFMATGDPEQFSRLAGRFLGPALTSVSHV